MRILKWPFPLLLLVILIGCNRSGQIVGVWTMAEKGQTWEFKGDGTMQIDASVGAVDVKQDGTYTLSGNKLTVDLSGKNLASSDNPREKIMVEGINQAKPRPRQQNWGLVWTSPNEFTITSNGSGSPVTRTLDRKN